QVRLGRRYVLGLREQIAKQLVSERSRTPFASIAGLSARIPLRREELATLAEIGALASLPIHPGVAPGTRRAALWQAEAALRRPPGLFSHIEPSAADPTANPPAHPKDARTDLPTHPNDARADPPA